MSESHKGNSNGIDESKEQGQEFADVRVTSDANTKDFFAWEVKEAEASTTRKSELLKSMFCLICCLYGSAMLFAFLIICFLSKGSKFDWHILLSITTVLTPPTILAFALIRGVFKVSKSSETPIGDAVEQLETY